MADAHQWVYRYRAPIAGGQVINQARPGEQIAKAISEIQDVITHMQGGDGEGESTLPLTADLNDVLRWDGSAWVAGYVRAKA
jgi:hypothetical protein